MSSCTEKETEVERRCRDNRGEDRDGCFRSQGYKADPGTEREVAELMAGEAGGAGAWTPK